MDSQDKLDEARRIAREVDAARDALRARCAELEHAKDEATGSPEAFDAACEAHAAAHRDLDRAERAAVRAAQVLREAERAHSRGRLRDVLTELEGASAAVFGKVQAVAADLGALHASVSDLESTLRRAGELSDQASALAAECADSMRVKSSGELRALAVATYLVALHELQIPAANLQLWLVTPPTSPDDLCERVRLILSYPVLTTRYRDLELSSAEQLAAMLDGSFYALMRERRAEEQRRIDAGIAERNEEQRVQFEQDVAAAMRAGQVDRRTAVDRVMGSLRYDASVVLPERPETMEASP